MEPPFRSSALIMSALGFISCLTGGIERIESERPTVLPNVKSKAHGASPFSVPIFSAAAPRLRLIMQKAGYVVGGISEIVFLRMFLCGERRRKIGRIVPASYVTGK